MRLNRDQAADTQVERVKTFVGRIKFDRILYVH